MNALLAAVTPSPSPTTQAVGSGSPGFIGFVFTFALAIAAVLLFLSLTRHLRVVQRRSAERDEAEAAAGYSDVGPAGADLEIGPGGPAPDPTQPRRDPDDEGRG